MPALFSSRVPDPLSRNKLAHVHERLVSGGASVVDLTASNPTLAGFQYPKAILDALGSDHGLSYRPDPLGLRSARDGVAAYLRGLGLDVDGRDVVLTASTSDAYSLLFKLLCDPGHEVAVPRPSYPLLEHLTRLDSVAAVPYTLEYHGRWEIDLGGLERLISTATRAVVMVNPNNPTGSFVSSREIDGVVSLCRDRDVALIVDEVFGVYPMASSNRGPSVLDRAPDVLTFVLGGLSKAIGLPGVKLGWMVVAGPRQPVARALDRLELLCDTYLSVATPVQLAVEDLLSKGAGVTTQIAERVRRNYQHLERLVATYPAAGLLPVEGGWYAVVQVPATASEEMLVLDLLNREHILVHPGYFFDFPREAFLVMSLLPETVTFESATERVLSHVTERLSIPS